MRDRPARSYDRLSRLRRDIRALYLIGEGLAVVGDKEDGAVIMRIASRLGRKVERTLNDIDKGANLSWPKDISAA
jgi:hypothetical protein